MLEFITTVCKDLYSIHDIVIRIQVICSVGVRILLHSQSIINCFILSLEMFDSC